MEFIAKNSGKSIKIVPASFKVAMNLKKEAFKCLNRTNALEKVKDLKNIELATLFSELANLLVEADTSDGFNKAVMECLSVCICDGSHAITEQFFNDTPALWEDYYEIVANCVEVNLRPFFKSLASELQTRFSNLEEPQAQELPQAKI
jgi:hypothetical protein